MRKITSLLLAILILGSFTCNVLAFENLETMFTKGIDAIGLTFTDISISKNGSTASIVIDTSSSNLASQIGFKNGYIQQKVNGIWTDAGPIDTYYSTNTSFQTKSFTFTMTKGVEYRVTVQHYCIINGVTYPQTQTTSAFSM